MTEEEGFIVEAALDCGAWPDDDLEHYTFTEAQLLEFARRMRASASVRARRVVQGLLRDVLRVEFTDDNPPEMQDALDAGEAFLKARRYRGRTAKT